MANIRDIARLAGVSIATVSHVLNETRPVLPETRERVLSAARELDYQPNMVARSLRRKHTETIGLVVSDIDTPYISEFIHSVEATASERGYCVILCSSGESVEREASQIEMLLAKQVEGLILIPAAGRHAFLKDHLRRGARIVLANRYLRGVPCPAVIADDEEAAYALTRCLLQKGHRRVGAASWVEGVSTYENRWKGFARALEEWGISPAGSWRFRGNSRPDDGRLAARQLAALDSPPTAVVCFNSLVRDGIILELFSLAPHLLTEIEIAGFGYSALANLAGSSRHYVVQPSHEIGTAAASYLLDVLGGIRDWNPSDRIVVRTSLAEFGRGASKATVGSTVGQVAR